jgi:hypothetical protein
MTDSLDLFSSPPEHAGDYQVPTLRAHGDEHRGDWLVLWAEAKHALYGHQDREAVMRLRGLDPEQYLLYPAGPINVLTDGFKKTWWYCWDKGKPPLQPPHQGE